MAFTDIQKTDIRRHCGFPMYGNQATPAFGYRYFTQYGTLEFRINNASPAEEVVISNFVTELNLLETAVVDAGDNLDTDKAAVWVHNKDEVRDRRALYSIRRKDLCRFIGVNPGPAISGMDTVSI